MFVEHDKRVATEPFREPQLSPAITKLSQAIREGAKLRPRCTGVWFDAGRSCALGAAFEAYYGRKADMTTGVPSDRDKALLGVAFPELRVQKRKSLYGTIYRMNDNGDTREAIADWLEGQGF